MNYFDYTSVAREAGISESDLQRICELMRREYPGDSMMAELHVLRACMALRDGRITIQELLIDEPAVRA